MKQRLFCAGLSLWLGVLAIANLSPSRCLAHDEFLHRKISKSAFRSCSGVAAFLTDVLGPSGAPFETAPGLTASPPPYSDSGGSASLSPLGWIEQGSYYEDETFYGWWPFRQEWRTIDHFYTLRPDCAAGRVSGLSDWSEAPLRGRPIRGVDSFRWASQRGIFGPFLPWVFDVGPNTETWQNARDYEDAALTASQKSVRDENMAHMCYALGHVLHINQDLTSPDHVRNDNHLHRKHKYIELYGEYNFRRHPEWFALPPPERRGWPYWRDTGFKKLEDFWDRHWYNGNDSQALVVDAPHGVSENRLGLAEFSNGNFLGEDALYKEYFNPDDLHYFPFPALASTDWRAYAVPMLGWRYVAVEYLRNGVQGQRVFLRKIGDGVHVQHHSVLNYTAAKIAANSIRLSRQVESSVRSANVLEDYHSILIPKAIEYSAGILDYFFRGKLGTTVTMNPGGTYRLAIQNLSGANLKGGAFRLFWDDFAGTRSELSSENFSIAWGDSSTLADGATVFATVRVTPQAVAKYMLVYRGTIGTSAGTALDPVDADIAIAAKAIPAARVAKCEVFFNIWDHRSWPDEQPQTNPPELTPADHSEYMSRAISAATEAVGESAPAMYDHDKVRTIQFDVEVAGTYAEPLYLETKTSDGELEGVISEPYQAAASWGNFPFEEEVVNENPPAHFWFWKSHLQFSANCIAVRRDHELACRWRRHDGFFENQPPQCEATLFTLDPYFKLTPESPGCTQYVSIADAAAAVPPLPWQLFEQYERQYRFISLPGSGEIYPDPTDTTTVGPPACCGFPP